MSLHETNPGAFSLEDAQEQSRSTTHRRRATKVTQARAKAQRAKTDHEEHVRQQQKAKHEPEHEEREEETKSQTLQARRRARMTIERAINDYLDDHAGGNHSDKTLEWHRTSLGLLQRYLKNGRDITLVGEIDAPDIVAWFTYLRKTPGGHGKMRSERTVQTYARSARAFFYWLVRQGTITENPFERVTFPKVGKPLIKTISEEEFEQLLLACAPPNEEGQFAERAAVRNRAILWLFYDSGIRLSELINLRLGDFDRKHGLITVKGKGSKERRIALGQNCLRNVLHYLDRHRPDEKELAEWGSLGEDHVFLAETRKPLTKNSVTLLFVRLKKRAGITGKRISPHIFRHTFAIRYLKLSRDPFSLQELLGHEDIATVKLYMHMNDEEIQEKKREYSPSDHLSARMPGPRETRRRGYRPADQNGNKK
ncbi:tyrosine-type recombinase/integrase [Ktedonobacteria bacterium brp13]|nr:tyrosine-type recombinase/integrase [Ktedonobacteria bacterium brp13]